MANFIKRLMKADNSVSADSSVAVGDRFQQLDHSLSIWVVERISKVSSSNLPLISLSRVGRPDLKKILSLSVLEEGEDFRPTIQ